MSVTLAMRRLFVPLVLAMLTMLTMLGCVADPSANLEPEPIDARAYGWATEIGELPPSTTLETRFPAPVGHARAKVDASSFAGWLRGLPVRLDRRSVLDHRGRKRAWNSAGVITLDVGTKDLQQCADTLLRLHGEWLWSQGRTRELAYHFTSGDLSRFSDWIAGRRLQVDGATVRTIDAESVPSDRAALRMWFEQLFMYAGTRSLELDTEPVPLESADRRGRHAAAPRQPRPCRDGARRRGGPKWRSTRGDRSRLDARTGISRDCRTDRRRLVSVSVGRRRERGCPWLGLALHGAARVVSTLDSDPRRRNQKRTRASVTITPCGSTLSHCSGA